MCLYMVENGLYDEYYFETFNDIIKEFKNKDLDNILTKDIDTIEDYLKKDEIKSAYYDTLSTLYDDEK